MAATTTLPLFWHLASANKVERIDASVKLVSTLQQFQDKHVLETSRKQDSPPEDTDSDGEGSEENNKEGNKDELKLCSAQLDAENAADVAYAIRRLIRGLASPRESSRLGFAVALTELLSRLDTITCGQFLTLLDNASQTTNSMSGQEERDILFAKLFGLKCVVQSGLLFSQKPMKSSSTTSSSFKDLYRFMGELLSLGDKKSWLRESCWWTLLSAVDALTASNVSWKGDTYAMIFDRVYTKDKSWSLEKVALTLKLQKSADILSTPNLSALGRLLKDTVSEELSEEGSRHTSGPWKPQLHFVWDVIFDILLSSDNASRPSGNFQDFYRIIVDESLFSSSSSPQRKYWGFLVLQKALKRLPSSHLPMLFTQNFMRTWINQLAKQDRYLHKIARQVASDIQQIVEKDPRSGLTLILQLTGTNGSFHFDRITKTKTVENVIANMDAAGIEEYIAYLLKHVNDGPKKDSFASVDSRRLWIIDQLAVLLRKGSIPKSDESIRLILDWLTTHAFFKVIKKSSKGLNAALQLVPEPPFPDDIRDSCRSKLLSCLGDLTNLSTTVESKDEGKTARTSGVAPDGEFWVSKVLHTIMCLEKDAKHAIQTYELDDQKLQVRNSMFTATEKVKASGQNKEAARGVELLLHALTLRCLCESDSEAVWEDLQECIEAAVRLFTPAQKDGKKKKEESKVEKDDNLDDDRSPIDLIVDTIIGLLENSTNFTRVIANQSFSMLAPLVNESSVDLILAQLERRDPTEEALEADKDMDEEVKGSEDEGSDNDSEEEGSASSDEGSDEESDEESEEAVNKEDTEALQKALQAAVSGKNAESDNEESDGSSDEASMDDEQMMAIDDKLAEVFRTRAGERKKGKDTGAQREATYFKNRVLDLVEIYMRKQPSNPLILRFILPLVELIVTSSSDEKQLSDKAKGVLRARLSKTKDIPSVTDKSGCLELLESLHVRARKSHSQEIVSTINVCCLFVTKALIAVDEESVLRIYKDSITDFITRKASSLNPAFVVDFIRRHPVAAWSIRRHIIDTVGDAVNGYRQIQAFKLVQILLSSLPQPESKKEDILSFLAVASKTFLAALHKSCSAEKPLMTSVQMKESLEVALHVCRFSKRFVTDSKELEDMWTTKEWEELASSLSSSDHFKQSTSLPRICRQIIRLVQADAPNASQTTPRKRKKGVDSEGADPVDGDSARKKPKRKKVRKVHKSGD